MTNIAAWIAVPTIALCVGVAAAATAGGDATAGKLAFSECAGCHSLSPGENGIGPSLAGVVGRPVASVRGYDYSQALQSGKGRVWSAAQLNAYLTNPDAVYPGNKMGVAVANPKTRADIIAYLAQAKGK